MTWTKILIFAFLAGLTVGPASAIWCSVQRVVSGSKPRDSAGHSVRSSMGQPAPAEEPAGAALGSASSPSRRPFVF